MKQIKRRTTHPMEAGRQRLPEGTYQYGITAPDVAAAFAELVSYWPFVEDRMVGIFAELAGIDNVFDARVLFFTYFNQKSRIDTMTALLENSPRNSTKGQEFDNVIAEFAALNKIRNSYVHGVWRTHRFDKQGKAIDEIYLAAASTDDIYSVKVRKVGKRELDDTLKRMREFERSLSGLGKANPRA